MIKVIIFTCLTCMSIYLHAKPANEAGTKYNNFISPSSKSYYIQHEDQQIYQVKLLRTNKELAKGFSGIKPEQVSEHQGMFFYFPNSAIRNFWMPDTYFDLTIIFMNKNLQVTSIIMRAPHHIGTSEEKAPIFRAKPVNARYVLEIKANSINPHNIKIGDQFKWIGALPHGFQQK